MRDKPFIYKRDLLRELVVRDIKLRYKHSILGIAWSLLNPLLHLLVFFFIFRVVLALNFARFSSYVLIGLLVWNWFQDSLTQAARAITGNRELVKRPGFQVTILPVVSVVVNLIHFLLSIPILMMVILIEGAALGPTLLLLPVLIGMQYVLTLGLSYLVAGVNVMFRDTEHLLSIFLRLSFFLTPIFYDASRLPEQLARYYYLNPMVGLVDAYRAVLMGGAPIVWSSLIWPGFLALAFVGIGYTLFVRVNYRFAEEL